MLSCRLLPLRHSVLFFKSLLVVTVVSLLLRFCIFPILVLLVPELYATFYDIGLYGWYSERHYHSSNLTSPRVANPIWTSPICDAENEVRGLVLRDLHGDPVSHNGPTITNLQGELIWADSSYGHASNLKVQTWKGNEYLTFWAGERGEGTGKGRYYMLDYEFNLAKTVSAVGDGLDGDLHEFELTADDTALITIFDRIHIDLSGTHMSHLSGYIVDGIVQEVDIATGQLIFEWRASAHLDDGEYLKTSHGSYVTTDGSRPYDYFHLNSIQKDSAGNYLVSIRTMHMVICISGTTGGILWGLGGVSQDFEDLSDGRATDFMFQHNARWIDEERGILSLFNNGISEGHYHDASHSEGRIIHLDVENRTARLLHSYASLYKTKSISQGSLQFIPKNDKSEMNSSDYLSPGQTFVGWGSSSAWSLYDAESEELLCETHFAASLFFPFAFAKSYRATRAPPGWRARPANWDPSAVVKGDKLYVSWNGGMEVEWWTLQRAAGAVDGNELRSENVVWEDVKTAQRDGFETRMTLPSAVRQGLYHAYRVLALDANMTSLRLSNVVHSTSYAGHPIYFWPLLVPGLIFGVVVFHLLLRNERFRESCRLVVTFRLWQSEQNFRYTQLDSCIALDTLQTPGETLHTSERME